MEQGGLILDEAFIVLGPVTVVLSFEVSVAGAYVGESVGFGAKERAISQEP